MVAACLSVEDRPLHVEAFAEGMVRLIRSQHIENTDEHGSHGSSRIEDKYLLFSYP